MSYSYYVMNSKYRKFISSLDEAIEETIEKRFDEIADDYDYVDYSDYHYTFLPEAFEWEFDSGDNSCWENLFQRNLNINVSIQNLLMLQKEMIEEGYLDSEKISNNATNPYFIFNLYALSQQSKYDNINYHVKWAYGNHEKEMIKLQSLVRMKQSRIATIRKLHLTGSL